MMVRTEEGFTPSLRSPQAGFTLLEMLVALSILSLAALTLVRLDGYTIRSTATLSGRAMAQIVADNRAVELLTDPTAPTIGSTSSAVSNGGGDWQVTTTVATTADPSLLRIDIIVTGTNGERAMLTTIRPAA